MLSQVWRRGVNSGAAARISSSNRSAPSASPRCVGGVGGDPEEDRMFVRRTPSEFTDLVGEPVERLRPRETRTPGFRAR